MPVTARYYYGVQCARETFWPRQHWLPFRWYRWLLAWWLARDANKHMSQRFECGHHRVVRQLCAEVDAYVGEQTQPPRRKHHSPIVVK